MRVRALCQSAPIDPRQKKKNKKKKKSMGKAEDVHGCLQVAGVWRRCSPAGVRGAG